MQRQVTHTCSRVVTKEVQVCRPPPPDHLICFPLKLFLLGITSRAHFLPCALQVPYDVVIPEPVQVQVPVEQIVTQPVSIHVSACLALVGLCFRIWF